MEPNAPAPKPSQPNTPPQPPAPQPEVTPPPQETAAQQPAVTEQPPTSTPVEAQPAASPTSTPAPTPTVTQSPQAVTPMSTAEPVPAATALPGGGSIPADGGKAGKLKKFAVPIVAGAFLLLSGGALAFNAVVLNSPENVWKKAMSRTADGMDSFITALKEENRKGGSLNGTLSLESPIAADGKIEGKWYDLNSEISGELGISGLRFNADLRSIQAEGATYPDIYINATGISDLAGFAGPEYAPFLSQLDGEWIKFDRTLLAQGQIEAQNEGETPEITTEEIKELADRSAKVLRERLFTTDESKAVVQMQEFLGKEDFEGRATNKYSVKVSKENLKAFADAYITEIETTKIAENYLAQMPEGTTLAEALDLEELKKSIDEIDESKAVATAWVDTGYGLLRNVRIDLSDGSEDKVDLDLGLAYAGGDVLPFRMVFNASEEGTDNRMVVTLGADFNQKSKETTFTAKAEGDFDGQAVKMNAELKVVPSDEKVSPAVPAGARNILELFADPSMFIAPVDSFDDSEMFFDDIQL